MQGPGKTYLSAQLALAATMAGTGRMGDAVGLGVRGGPVGIVGYEDSPERYSIRSRLILGGLEADLPDSLFIVPNGEADPLFACADDNRSPEALPAWNTVAEWVGDVKPSLLIIDPVSEALENASVNNLTPVRAFMRSIADLSAEHGFGALLIAHPNKQARNEARGGRRPWRRGNLRLRRLV